MNYRQERAPDVYWGPDKWDVEYERHGCWVLPDREAHGEGKGCEMKLMMPGEPEPDRNRYIKPMTDENLLYWTDSSDKLDPAKRPDRKIDWSVKWDRNVLSWRDQFCPPDFTKMELMHQYDEDSMEQWETIHPSDWKTKHQSGNTFPPIHPKDGLSEWKAKYESPLTKNSKGKEFPDVGAPPGPYKMDIPRANRVVRVMRLTGDGYSDPSQSMRGMSISQLGLVAGAFAFIGGVAALGAWIMEYLEKRSEADGAAAIAQEEDKTYVNDEPDRRSEMTLGSTGSLGSWRMRQFKSSHLRDRVFSVDKL